MSGLLAALNPAATSVMGSGSGASQPRFDLTLLEMTKQVFDSSTTSPDTAAVPQKVRQALETVMGQLAEQDPELQARLGKDSQASGIQNALVNQAAKAAGLNVAQHKQLDELVNLTVQRVQTSLQPVMPLSRSNDSGTTLATPVTSGPLGGNTVAPDPSDSTSDIQALAPAKHEDERDLAKQLPQLAAAVPAPLLVSTRTQVSADPQSEQASPISGSQAQAADLQGQQAVQPRAVLLTPQAPQPAQAPETTAKASFPTQAVAQPAQPVEVAALPEVIATNNAQPASQPKAQAAQETVPSVSASSEQPAIQTSSLEPKPEAPVSAQPKPQAEAAIRAASLPDMPQIQVLSSTQALPEIVKGSEVTLENAKPETAQAQPVQARVFAASAEQPVVQAVVPQAVAAAPVQQAVPVVSEAPVENAPEAAFSADTKETKVTPMNRFMAEAAERLNSREATASVQAPVLLTRDSFRNLAESISKEYGVKKAVFEQAVAALEEASQQQVSQVRITLKPESLGSVDVALSMQGGKLTARLIASSPEVRDVFAANLSQFKQALEAQGLQVNQLSVAVRADTSPQGQQQQNPQWANQPAFNMPAEESPAPMAWTAFTAPQLGGSSSLFNALA